jgi:uncharacterized protein YjlB
MEKFLSIPVTGQPNQLVSVIDVVMVSAGTGATNNTAAATTTVITYQGGKAITLTHAAQAAYNMRTFIQDKIQAALATSWTNVVYTVTDAPVAVSQVTVA